MGIDLTKFKVVYCERVFNALALMEVNFAENTDYEAIRKKPKIIEVLIVNEDSNIEVLRDEAWMFQFIPIVKE